MPTPRQAPASSEPGKSRYSVEYRSSATKALKTMRVDAVDDDDAIKQVEAFPDCEHVHQGWRRVFWRETKPTLVRESDGQVS